jgi:prevent-host-death family protein
MCLNYKKRGKAKIVNIRFASLLVTVCNRLICCKFHVVFYVILWYKYYNKKQGVIHMPNILPVSDLRNYSEVLGATEGGQTVFLTKNGRGKYALMDIAEYERQQATIMLLSKLAEAESAIVTGEEWKSPNEVRDILGI